MRKYLRIEALNDNGVKAIKTHWDESEKQSWAVKKLQKKLGIRQDLLSEKVLIVKFNNPHLKRFNDIIEEIKEALEKNGASEKDYKITELEV